MSAEFSVYWWDIYGEQHVEKRFVEAEEAVNTAIDFVRWPFSSVLGLLKRVLITDGGDYAVWEWVKGEGITYPPELKGRLRLGGAK